MRAVRGEICGLRFACERNACKIKISEKGPCCFSADGKRLLSGVVPKARKRHVPFSRWSLRRATEGFRRNSIRRRRGGIRDFTIRTGTVAFFRYKGPGRDCSPAKAGGAFPAPVFCPSGASIVGGDSSRRLNTARAPQRATGVASYKVFPPTP